MKKASLALLTMIAMLSLMGCSVIADLFGGGTTTPTVQYSQWWVKGSFDGWKGGDDGSADPTDGSRHFLAINELNNKILTFEITGLYKQDYDFVVCGAGTGANNAGGTVYQVAAASATLAANTAVPLAAKNEPTTANMKITAAFTSYTVQVDITNATAPTVKIIPGTVASSYYTAAELAAGLKIKGNQFTIGWTDTVGIFDSTTNTVTWDLTASSKTGEFGFTSLAGFLKGATVASPTTAGTAAAAVVLGTTGNNCQITGIPNNDSVYTIAVTITPPSAISTAVYSMVVTLKTVGTTPWAFATPAAVYFPGSITTWIGSGATDAANAQATITGTVASFTFTAADATPQFKIVDAWNWNGLNLGFGGIEVDTTGIAIISTDTTTPANGNITFAATAGSKYTITADFSTTAWTTSGTGPKVKVVLAP